MPESWGSSQGLRFQSGLNRRRGGHGHAANDGEYHFACVGRENPWTTLLDGDGDGDGDVLC